MSDPTPQDMLGMDDEAFMNLNSPPATAGGDGSTDDGQSNSQQDDTNQQQDQNGQQQQADDADAQNQDDQGGQQQQDDNTDDDADANQQQGKDADAVKQTEAQQKVDDKSKEADTSTKDKSGKENTDGNSDEKSKQADGTTPNYEELYKKLMAPIKANGKTIEIRSPEEAVQLMQMGANYTRKMQAIAPHRKVLMMLENNGLLDEGKLSYLIDLDKKNPEAIKKLIKDAGIDPLQIDVEDDKSTYQPGNHQVTDEEATFVAVLEDLKSAPAGAETLRAINEEWDQASKEVLWKNPELMGTIHEQRQNGIYAMITGEVDRLRALGSIPANVSFLQAYKAVGDKLNAEGKFGALVQQPPSQQQADKQPVTTRVQQPKPPVKNGDKAQAAAPSRSSTKKAEPFVNPLDMSDEEFAKKFNIRL